MFCIHLARTHYSKHCNVSCYKEMNHVRSREMMHIRQRTLTKTRQGHACFPKEREPGTFSIWTMTTNVQTLPPINAVIHFPFCTLYSFTSFFVSETLAFHVYHPMRDLSTTGVQPEAQTFPALLTHSRYKVT